jgi:hypothetical protein
MEALRFLAFQERLGQVTRAQDRDSYQTSAYQGYNCEA